MTVPRLASITIRGGSASITITTLPHSASIIYHYYDTATIGIYHYYHIATIGIYHFYDIATARRWRQGGWTLSRHCHHSSTATSRIGIYFNTATARQPRRVGLAFSTTLPNEGIIIDTQHRLHSARRRRQSGHSIMILTL